MLEKQEIQDFSIKVVFVCIVMYFKTKEALVLFCLVVKKTPTESLQNLLIRHFGLLPLAVSVAIHRVRRVLRLDL